MDIKLRRVDVDEVDGFQEGGIKKMWEMWERKKKKGKMGEKRGNDVKRGRGHWRKTLRKTERERDWEGNVRCILSATYAAVFPSHSNEWLSAPLKHSDLCVWLRVCMCASPRPASACEPAVKYSTVYQVGADGDRQRTETHMQKSFSVGSTAPA